MVDAHKNRKLQCLQTTAESLIGSVHVYLSAYTSHPIFQLYYTPYAHMAMQESHCLTLFVGLAVHAGIHMTA